ncbi:MAG: hypothetical protein IMZ55_10865 [Acidobacteria bacterium]|nr:hypothetical protein [Acidobacteriota bacterium]
MTTRVGVFVALLVTLLVGWLWGASGSWEVVRALREPLSGRMTCSKRAPRSLALV